MTRKGIYLKAFKKYGEQAQRVMLMEECSELIQEVSKEYRGKGSDNALLSEIADVEIMIEQLLFMKYDNLDYTAREKIERLKHEKIERLRRTMEED